MRDISINLLRHGHEEGAPEGVDNVRKFGRDAGLDALGASILSLGLLQPLTAVAAGDLYFVVDGNRRLAALKALVADGKLGPDAEVQVILRDAKTAREAGLAANINQSPMHEADQTSAFVELRRAGLREKDIAARFATPVAHVKKLLALGGVSPAVLDAWRAGKLQISNVQALTLAPSHADQDRVLAQVMKDGCLWRIKDALGIGQSTARLMKYVGIKAYRAAGGTVVEDLFGSDDNVCDPALLKRLADERLKTECERRLKEGWAWTAIDDTLPSGWRWSWKTLKAGERAMTDEERRRYDELQGWLDTDDEDASDEQIAAVHAEVEQIEAAVRIPLGPEARAQSGCVVGLGYDGKLSIDEYVVRPVEAPESQESAGEAAKPEPKEKGLSAALVDRLAEQATKAVQAALPASPKAALAVLLAGALCDKPGYGGHPMKVSLDGLGGDSSSLRQGQAFDVVLAGLLERSVDELLLVAAHVAARGVDLQHYNHTAPSSRRDAMALMGAVDNAALTSALQESFDGEAYFKAIPKDAIVAVVSEVLGEEAARRVQSSKKSALVAFAVSEVLPTGWLPVEIRHPGYSGPGAAQAAAAALAA